MYEIYLRNLDGWYLEDDQLYMSRETVLKLLQEETGENFD